MRHLSVPTKRTSEVRLALQRRGWLAQGHRIKDLGDRRGIPLDSGAPEDLGVEFSRFALVDLLPEDVKAKHWHEVLEHMVGQTTFRTHADQWPDAYDVVGDLILLKIQSSVMGHATTIAEALIEHHPRIRGVLMDRGVVGTYRVRDLLPLAWREGVRATTVTRHREHGLDLSIDPTEVYFSPRLAEERLRMLNTLTQWRDALRRPLAIIDAYAGVGPNLSLLNSRGLASEIVANDLNPAAHPFLKVNLPDGTRILNQDGRSLREQSELQGRFDVVIVNLPHESLGHLSDLRPLLRPDSGMIIGWAIVQGTGDHPPPTSLVEGTIHDMGLDDIRTVRVERSRGFSTTRTRVRFEITFMPRQP